MLTTQDIALTFADIKSVSHGALLTKAMLLHLPCPAVEIHLRVLEPVFRLNHVKGLEDCLHRHMRTGLDKCDPISLP